MGQVQQAADRADVGANQIRRYLVFIVSFPMRKQGFDGFFAIRVANGFDRRAPAQRGDLLMDPAFGLFLRRGLQELPGFRIGQQRLHLGLVQFRFL